MAWPSDETIWPQVSLHTWKYAVRKEPVRLILLHSTRGDNTMELQYQATKNWQISPNNKSPDGTWGSISSRIISHQGQLCVSLPDEYYPTWSGGHMDPIAISYELAQPTDSTPFTEACLERAALEVAKDCLRFNIPAVMLPFVSGDNHEAPGICRHDHTANGLKWGKSDPGKMFDNRAFEARVKKNMEAPMPKILTPEEALKYNAQSAFHLNDSRDLGKIATVIQYIYRVKGWPWPAA